MADYNSITDEQLRELIEVARNRNIIDNFPQIDGLSFKEKLNSLDKDTKDHLLEINSLRLASQGAKVILFDLTFQEIISKEK